MPVLMLLPTRGRREGARVVSFTIELGEDLDTETLRGMASRMTWQ